MSWLDKLQSRWGLKSLTQVIVVLIVFACTGFSVLFLKRPVVAFFTTEGETNIWFSVIYYILILPIYNVILLFYGFIFGQFSFFWAFEKRMWYRMTGRKQNAE
jgi:hypothetical protein